MRLSACMMVRNERENLPRCLRALNALKVFDEVVVVDTGSTDETVEIAREFGARVIIPENIDDLFIETEFGRAINFAKARNLTIENATGDWVYLLDADEETVGDASDLKEFIEKKLNNGSDAIGVQFEDYKAGKKFMQFIPPRIFKRGNVRFENIVHNRAVGYKEPIIFYPGIRIKHTGYDLTPEQAKAKRMRTLGLLKKQLEIDPESHWCWFYIAQIYGGDLQDYRATIDASVKYIEAKEKVHRFNPSVYYTLSQACILVKDEAAADRWIGEAIRELPEDMDVAAAVCDFGAWRQKPNVLAAGCEMFLAAWEKIKRDPLSLGSRFLYNYNNETLARVLFHVSFLRFAAGMEHLRRLRSVMLDLDPGFARIIDQDLEREHKRIGIALRGDNSCEKIEKNGGPFKNGKKKKNRRIRGIRKKIRRERGERVRYGKVRGGIVQGARA